MKTTFKLNSLVFYKTTLFFLLLILFAACKKEADLTNSNIVSSNQISDAKTDGIITVQPGILPPVTQKSFIANGQTSQAQFQIRTRKRIFLYQLVFVDSAKTIQYVVVNGSGIGPDNNGIISFDAAGPYIEKDSGYTVNVEIHYKNVDSATSGVKSRLVLTTITYRTDDEKYHDFYPPNGAKAPFMCLVKNVPHFSFQNPVTGDVSENGYVEIAEVKLTGDTGWALNELPLNLYSPVNGTITNAKLTVKINNVNVAASTDSVTLTGGGNNAQALIRFQNGYKHIAGNTEILKIYAPVTGLNALIYTTFNALGSFVWTDDSGRRIQAGRNKAFFNDQTGQSQFQ